MSNRLLKFKNIEPLLGDELFVRALQLESPDEYKRKLSWDEKNKYIPFHHAGLGTGADTAPIGVSLLSTPHKGRPVIEHLGTSLNVIKLFDRPLNPFCVVGVEIYECETGVETRLTNFGSFQNLHDAARVAIAIHENNEFVIPECLDEKPEAQLPDRPIAVRQLRDQQYLSTLKKEIKELEDKIFDKKIWVQEAKSQLLHRDPDGVAERACQEMELRGRTEDNWLDDPETLAEYTRLSSINQLINDIKANEYNLKQNRSQLDAVRLRHDAFIERTYGKDVGSDNLSIAV